MQTLQSSNKTPLYSQLLSGIGLLLIRIYQLTFSPAKQFLFGPTAACRFHPSCSDYAHQCVKSHGLLYGSYLTAIRLIKCGPWHPGGIDEAPSSRQSIKSFSNH